MIIRALHPQTVNSVQPAYRAFLQTQSNQESLLGMVLQSEHSSVAGTIAKALQPEVFGSLNDDVVAAISQHDFGWDSSDMLLVERAEPLSFTTLSAEDTLPCWIGSIARGRSLGALAGVLISRHCCLLGTGSEKHAAFIRQETSDRRKIEQTLSYSDENLSRWTAALGFCDLLSLYLSSGSQSSVVIPLEHPEATKTGATIQIRWVDGVARLSQPILTSQLALEVSGYEWTRQSCSLKKTIFECTVAAE